MRKREKEVVSQGGTKTKPRENKFKGWFSRVRCNFYFTLQHKWICKSIDEFCPTICVKGCDDPTENRITGLREVHPKCQTDGERAGTDRQATNNNVLINQS